MSAEWWEFQTEAVRRQVYDDLQAMRGGDRIELPDGAGAYPATVGKRIKPSPRDYWVSGFLAGCEHGAATARGENPATVTPPMNDDREVS